MDVFPRLEDRQVHIGVGGWIGEVDNHLDRRIGQQLVDAADPGHAELGGAAPRAIEVQVGAGDHLQNRQPLAATEVLQRDGAAADYANGYGRHDATLAASSFSRSIDSRTASGDTWSDGANAKVQ